jgi:DNA-binding MarR family transcriptional regulator
VPSLQTTARATPVRPATSRKRGAPDLPALLRSSHIFASTVHDLLLVTPLRLAAPHALTPSQCNLLRIVSLDGRHPIGQAAQLLGISAPAATKTIDKLERLGLVVRRRRGSDRRTRMFAVTPAGREVVRRCDELRLSRLQAALKGFPRRDVDDLFRLLGRFSVSLLRGEPAGSGPCLHCAAYVEPGCPVERVRGGCPYREFIGGHGRAKAGDDDLRSHRPSQERDAMRASRCRSAACEGRRPMAEVSRKAGAAC